MNSPIIALTLFGKIPVTSPPADDEAWYVLEGVLRLQVGKDVVEALAGSGVFIPRGTAHT